MEERKIILKGPETSAMVFVSDDQQLEDFNHFISWLREYRPATYKVDEPYPIKDERKLMSCRMMAKKLGLEVSVI